MKTEKRPPRLEDVDFVPDAAERLERAVKYAFRKQSVSTGKPRRVAPLKPKPRRAPRRPRTESSEK